MLHDMKFVLVYFNAGYALVFMYLSIFLSYVACVLPATVLHLNERSNIWPPSKVPIWVPYYIIILVPYYVIILGSYCIIIWKPYYS